jgi:methylated-DNA-[protein]-cysteine S-methyltransferase
VFSGAAVTVIVKFSLFDTSIGAGGIAWGDRGVLGVQLPEQNVARVRARLRRRFPDAVESPPSPEIEQTVERITALMRGEPCDLSTVRLDVERIPTFAQRVYEIARTIPAGKTMTYGQIATQLGDPLLAREVGQALGRNPFPIVVPCHRVLAAGGKLGGFSASGGVATKQRLLSIERANVSWQLSLDEANASG